MTFQTLGDKPDFMDAFVRNDEATSIPRGTPVILALDGTEDGLAVELPASSSQALADRFAFGVALDIIATGAIGKARMFGVVREGLIRRATRAANTDNWAGSTSIALGVLLSIDTVNNCFSTSPDTVSYDSNASITLSMYRSPLAYLAESLISFNSTSSTGTVYGTALTQLKKVFVRML